MKLFITGTDTNVGKTYIATQLLRHYHAKGLTTIGLKPIASGAYYHNHTLYNEDALALQAAASIQLDYDIINPLRFEPAIAPHLAAAAERKTISVDLLNQLTQPALAHPADLHLIEGAGGWLLPLNHQETMADYVKQQQCDVILVVGMRLGCLNHALLTAQSIKQHGCRLIGWIANCLEPEMALLQENISSLASMMEAPLMHTVSWGGTLE